MVGHSAVGVAVAFVKQLWGWSFNCRVDQSAVRLVK